RSPVRKSVSTRGGAGVPGLRKVAGEIVARPGDDSGWRARSRANAPTAAAITQPARINRKPGARQAAGGRTWRRRRENRSISPFSLQMIPEPDITREFSGFLGELFLPDSTNTGSKLNSDERE